MNAHQTQLQRRVILCLGTSLALVAAGCRHLSSSQATSTGTSSFVVVDGPPAKTPKVKPAEPSTEPIIEEHFVDAEAIEPRARPTYPKQALTGKAGLVTVGVRITIDTEGQVADVEPSLFVFSTPSRYADEFQTAVRLAVLQWRFHPAQRYRLRIFRTEEGGGPPQEISREKIETYFDFAFTFTASGKVLPVTSAR